MRRFWTVSFVLPLFLGACQVVSPPCLDPWGCLEIPPDGKLLIGLLPSLYGRFSATGSQILQAVLNAVSEDEFILGRDIEVDWIGVDCDDGSLDLAAQRLVLIPNLLAVIGPPCPVIDRSVSLLFDQAGIPQISPSQGGEVAYRRIVAALQAVAILRSDKTLVVPRSAFWQALQRQP
ncbi:MAG: hypothetical protein N2049_08705 [Anaerolineales bacterium]|nr:hypothetical protein [Anaerolineales bacterium]